MDTYYGVIYFRDGRRIETANCCGAGAEQNAERMTAQQFDQYMRTATHDVFKPTRYEVKKR